MRNVCYFYRTHAPHNYFHLWTFQVLEVLGRFALSAFCVSTLKISHLTMTALTEESCHVPLCSASVQVLFGKAFVWVLVIRTFRSISWLQVCTWFSYRLARPWFFVLANFAANTICLFGLIDKRYCSLCRASWRSRSCFSCLVSLPSSKQVGEIENSSVLWSRLALSLSSMLVKSSTLGL